MVLKEELTSLAESGNLLRKLLKLRCPPIGIALGKRAPKGLSKLDGRMEFCRMWNRAFEGKCFFVTVENHSCITSQYYLGLKRWKGKVCRFLVDEVQAFCSYSVVNKYLENVPKISKTKTRIICVAPLEKADFLPDLILLRCFPEQAMLFLWAYSYLTGEIVVGETGTAMCISLVIKPYLDEKPAFSLGDPGGRYILGLAENEVACVVPVQFLNKMVEILRLRLKDWKT